MIFAAIRNARSSRHKNDRQEYVASIKTKLGAFDAPDANLVKDQIAVLRSQRQAGALNDADYAATVAALLGSPDSTIAYPLLPVGAVHTAAVRKLSPELSPQSGLLSASQRYKTPL